MAKIKIVGNIVTNPGYDVKLTTLLEEIRKHKESMFFPSVIEDRSQNMFLKRYQVNVFSEFNSDDVQKEIDHVQKVLDKIKKNLPLVDVRISFTTEGDEKIIVFTKEGQKEFLEKARWR